MSLKPISRARIHAIFLAATIVFLPLTASAEHAGKSNHSSSNPVANAATHLWQYPTDIASRNLYYGPGGKEHAPHTVFTFVKEDPSGTNPKFDVRDESGVKWKVKLGVEARPETVASRLVWAVGYYANEDYFLSTLRVENMPPLRRGQNLVASDGSLHNVRLKRDLEDEKKVGSWKWRDNPFSHERELNGLRVLMALMNNWDLKDENNSIYEEEARHGEAPQLHYTVSDLGASFGTTGLSWTYSRSKGNLESYRQSNFIRKVTPEYVDFTVPSRPALIYVLTPKQFISRVKLRWLGRHIPREDAKWMGGLLARLSRDQIRDAFRAAGYTPQDIEGFSAVIEARIAELNSL